MERTSGKSDDLRSVVTLWQELINESRNFDDFFRPRKIDPILRDPTLSISIQSPSKDSAILVDRQRMIRSSSDELNVSDGEGLRDRTIDRSSRRDLSTELSFNIVTKDQDLSVRPEKKDMVLSRGYVDELSVCSETGFGKRDWLE